MVLASLTLWTRCKFNVNTAHIDAVKMCDRLNDNRCTADNPTFSSNTPYVFISCQLKNAPKNTDVLFEWFYYGQKKMRITSNKVSSGDKIGTLNLQSDLSMPNNGWPVGEYEVVVTILGTDKEPVVKKFTVQ